MDAASPDPLASLVDRVPEGWTQVSYDGRAWGLRRTTHGSGRSLSVYAEELGGRDVVSANVYRTESGDVLKPCEMPEATVLAFLRGWRLPELAAGSTSSDGRLVVVMGVSGSGKSTVGAALALRLGVPYVDGDDLHPAANVAKMAAGHALDDADRGPWLDTVGGWLADHAADGGVCACSALKRRYRDQLRRHAPAVTFLDLEGSREVIARRQAHRPGHFMPASLLASQFADLEPLAADEPGLRVDVDQDVRSVVEDYLAATGLGAVGGG